ncbi:hypothetical protein P154DRAFT_21289 [Amniculicola lignicola CBS 123094]|uniref:Rhodopsin domain-containing protein n=1 Tax=Amniculicola lignicola CBS 123094 TaxID=1392246 RepID=A0A6A5WSP7_9PLEO|nr:hypothetical protein P154DRAFT_21289 [Amniculicola lignicola CBS 123094]
MPSQFEIMLAEMFANPPDPLEPLPLANRKGTIYATTLTFLVVSWIAVLFRLWVRFRILNEPGWDDFFVTLSATFNTVATILVLISVKYGLGQHFIYLPIPGMSKYLSIFYAENAIYITESALIKVSLLLQYLRIFNAGTMRWICLSLLVVISGWGLTFSFMAWFPCFPPKAYWDRLKYPDATCYGFGYKDANSFNIYFASHTATNMVFDIIVFLTPMVLFSRPNLRTKNYLTLTAIFLFGAVVVFTSVWRLYTIIEHRAATKPYIDFTWWAPTSILLSCLEIDLAVICASMPVFWPVLEKSFSQIFVTYEVKITEHRRYDNIELDNNGRATSLKTSSGASDEELRLTMMATKSQAELHEHYKDQYVVGHVDPFRTEPTLETNVNSDPQPPPKWNI